MNLNFTIEEVERIRDADDNVSPTTVALLCADLLELREEADAQRLRGDELFDLCAERFGLINNLRAELQDRIEALAWAMDALDTTTTDWIDETGLGRNNYGYKKFYSDGDPMWWTTLKLEADS